MALPPRRPPAKPVQTTAKPLPRPIARSAPKPLVRPTARETQVYSRGTEDGFDKARRLKEEQDAEMARKRNIPFPFRMKVGEKTKNPATGKEEPGVELLLLDTVRMPKMPYFHYYHRWGFVNGKPGSGKEDICLQDTPEGCPLCEDLGKVGRWELNLTGVAKQPYRIQNGQNAGKIRPMQRVLVTAKSKMIPHFEDLYKDHKTFRGMVVRMFRDNDKDESIGSRVKFIKFITEQDIRKLPPEMIELTKYEEAWPLVDRETLARRNKLNVGAGAGDGVGSQDFTGDADDIPF